MIREAINLYRELKGYGSIPDEATMKAAGRLAAEVEKENVKRLLERKQCQESTK